MKKIVIIILGLVLIGCTASDQKSKQNICKANGNLKDNDVISTYLWDNDIQLEKSQLENQCLEPFEVNKNQLDMILKITDGVYPSTNDINIIDETLNTNLQSFAKPEFYDKVNDAIINLIKEKRMLEKIEIKKNRIYLNEEELTNIKGLTVIRNEQKNPYLDFGIYTTNKENQEIRILLSSEVKGVLTIIEVYDLRNEGYDIYKVYHHFKRAT